jgi:hypothetical protein
MTVAFFEKILDVDAKLNSKTHLKNKFLAFWAVLLAFGLKVCKKCQYLYEPKNFYSGFKPVKKGIPEESSNFSTLH